MSDTHIAIHFPYLLSPNSFIQLNYHVMIEFDEFICLFIVCPFATNAFENASLFSKIDIKNLILSSKYSIHLMFYYEFSMVFQLNNVN